MDQRAALRAIAVVEALKGLVVLLAATGLASLLHHDLHDWAVRLVRHAHLNPASRYPQIFIDAAANLQNTRLLMLALGALGYALLRGFEAYGLYHGRAWAEVLAAASGAIYVPWELLGLLHHPHWLGAVLFLVNIGVVAVMLWALLQRRQHAPAGGPDERPYPR